MLWEVPAKKEQAESLALLATNKEPRRHYRAARRRRNNMNRLLYLATLSFVATLMLASAALGQERVRCRDFAFQEDAQTVYEQNPRANRRLDRDRDGIACEHLPSKTGDRVPMLDDLTPAERRRLPTTGASDSILPLLMGAMVLLGAGLVSRTALWRAS